MIVFIWSLVFLTNAKAEDADTFSPVFSYQYQDSLSNPDAQTTITSSIVSYQYYDWPGDENLTFQSSPTVSYYYEGAPQITTQPLGLAKKVGQTATFQVAAQGSTPLTYQWRINGVNITGATSPTYAIANVQAVKSGSYSVVVRNAYGSMASKDAALYVLLAPITPLSDVPLITPVSQLLAIALTEKPIPITGTHLISMNTNHQIYQTRKTVVLTHGWKTNSSGWPVGMADAFKSVYGDNVNILVWDWRDNANLDSIDPSKSANQTVAEGVALGKALMDALGPYYSEPIHFIGHSLGVMVNCAAADYIHDGTHRPRGDTRPATQVYSSLRTQMTMLDEAELVTGLKGVHIALDALKSVLPFVGPWLADGASADAKPYVRNFASKVIPDNFQYIDNYLSIAGLPHAEAVNALLWRNAIRLNPEDQHSYAVSWYQYTVSHPTASFLGDKWSFERNTINAAGTSNGLPPQNSYYLQNDDLSGSEYGFTNVTEAASQYADGSGKILMFPSYAAYQGLSTASRAVDSAAILAQQKTIKYYGNMVAKIDEYFAPPPGQAIYLGTADSTAAYYNQTGTSPGNVFQIQNGLEFSVQPGASQSQNIQVQMKSQAVALSANPTAANTVYSIIPVHVPREAVAFTFEYMIEGAAVEDYMTMGINTVNKLTTEAKYLNDGEWNSTPPIIVTDYIDQDVELVFALNGTNTPPTGKLSVRNIQFYIPERPQLDLEMTTASVKASWPISAIDWTLEATDDLTNPNWQPVEGTPDDTDYFHTMAFDLGTSKHVFFRLRK